jgi:hypothetical protein
LAGSGSTDRSRTAALRADLGAVCRYKLADRITAETVHHTLGRQDPLERYVDQVARDIGLRIDVRISLAQQAEDASDQSLAGGRDVVVASRGQAQAGDDIVAPPKGSNRES